MGRDGKGYPCLWHHMRMMIYIYIYMCVCVCVYACKKIRCSYKERKNEIFKNEYLHLEMCIFSIIYFVLTYLYVSSCCFCQCTYVTLGHINGAPNETRTHSCRFVSEFGSYWVPHLYGLVLYMFSDERDSWKHT